MLRIMCPTPPASPRSGDVTSDEIAARLAKEKANDAAAAAQLLEKERQATLDRVAQAEEEAAVAAKERDAAAARASEALLRAAKERVAAAAAATSAAPGGASSSTSSLTPPDLASAMIQHKAMALLQLHAQAVTVNNIRNHVTTVLDVDSGNFNRWRDQFLLILGKFSLQTMSTRSLRLLSPDWARMDCIVKSWIVATLTDDLAEIISA
jgi:hypothetical protein